MKYFLAALFTLFTLTAFTQDSLQMHKMVDTLASPFFWGRGYTNNGMGKAADFIAATYKQYNIQPLNGKEYFQNFSYPVNTFPGKMEVSINDKNLVPGVDFIVSPDSKGKNAQGNLRQTDSVTYVDAVNKIIIKVEKKLTWSVASEVSDYTIIKIDKKRLPEYPNTISINIKNKLNKKFKAANVCGIVPGTLHPDSIIFITAHYDHLGGMGAATYFPGGKR